MPVGTSIVTGSVGLLCKAFLAGFTKLNVKNLPVLIDAIHHRPAGTPLLTVSNHTSSLDDPLMFGILPLSTLCHPQAGSWMRWSLGAEELLFTNALYRWFFTAGQVLPIRRGQGIGQPSMDRAVHLMKEGGWVHIFPEGRIIGGDPEWGRGKRLKWGVSRLISESPIAPLLIPIMHWGMDRIKPVHEGIRLFQSVQIAIGDPINLTDLRDTWNHIEDEALRRSTCSSYVESQLSNLHHKHPFE